MRHPGVPDPARPATILVPAPARPYQGHRAGIITRCAAGAVDLAVAVLAVLVAYAGWAAALFLLRPRAFRFPEPAPGSLLTALLVVLTAYLAVGWVTTGQTYGARLMGLRVVDRHGHRLGPGRRARAGGAVRPLPGAALLGRCQPGEPLRAGRAAAHLRRLRLVAPTTAPHRTAARLTDQRRDAGPASGAPGHPSYGHHLPNVPFSSGMRADHTRAGRAHTRMAQHR